MIRIDSTIQSRAVEIDGTEYDIAPRTVEVCEKLLEAGRANLGKPAYRLKLAELRILLGETAFRQLFADRDRENVDRIDIIYRGVSQAFTATEEELQAEDVDAKIDQMVAALGPLNELLRNVRALSNATGGKEKENSIKEIRRG